MAGPENSAEVLVWVKDSSQGKTYPRRARLKAAGYLWNPDKERWEAHIPQKNVNHELHRWGVQCRCNVGTDEKKFLRSTTYRKRFLETYAGYPDFHCSHCHQKLRTDVPADDPRYLTVDHIISVGSVNGNPDAVLYRKVNFKQAGLTDINDIKNLIPKCRACNEKKGARESMGVEIYGFNYRRYLEKQYARWKRNHPESQGQNQS